MDFAVCVCLYNLSRPDFFGAKFAEALENIGAKVQMLKIAKALRNS